MIKIGKYEAIRNFLRKNENKTISISYEEINGMLTEVLPPSAYKYREWWANSRSHTQAHSWLNAGWKVEEVILGKAVKFIKVK